MARRSPPRPEPRRETRPAPPPPHESHPATVTHPATTHTEAVHHETARPSTTHHAEERTTEHREESTRRPEPTREHRAATDRNPQHARPELSRDAHVASSYDDDQNRNIDHVLSIGMDLHGSRLALLAMLCLGAGENNFHTNGCNGFSGCGPCGRGCCGFFQIDCSKQAEHSYTDVDYWAHRAYTSGFYSYGGIIPIANAHPDYSPGRITNMCQGAYSNLDEGQAYYDRYLGEADALLAARVPRLGSGGGSTHARGPSVLQEIPPSQATSWLGPIKDVDSAGNIDNAWSYLAQGASAARGGAKRLLEYVLSQQTIDPTG